MASGETSEKTGRGNEINLCSVDCNTESQDESGGALLHALVTKNKNQTYQLRNEAQLNCVALRSELDDEVTCGAVKGQDERPFRGARDSPASHHRTSMPTSEEKSRRAVTSALTFMTFS